MDTILFHYIPNKLTEHHRFSPSYQPPSSSLSVTPHTKRVPSSTFSTFTPSSLCKKHCYTSTSFLGTSPLHHHIHHQHHHHYHHHHRHHHHQITCRKIEPPSPSERGDLNFSSDPDSYTASADQETASTTPGTGTGKKYSSQRVSITIDPNLNPATLNKLFVKAGKEPRDEDRWKLCFQNSYLIVCARLIGSGKLVAYCSVVSDEALNCTIWDLTLDPDLPNEDGLKRNFMIYVLREIRRKVPSCSVTLFAHPKEIQLLQSLKFVADPKGIRAMMIPFQDINIPANATNYQESTWDDFLAKEPDIDYDSNSNSRSNDPAAGG